MPFTTDGYEARRINEILEEIRQNLENDLGTPISSNPDNIFGIINSIYSNQLSIQENNTQALSNNLDINKAEGYYLDRIVAYIGLTRLAAQPSSGQVKVWRDTVGSLTSSILLKDSTGIQYICPNGLVHNLNSCAEVTLTPITVQAGLIYTVQVNGATIQYTASGIDTQDDVVDYFAAQITSVTGISATNVNTTLNIVGVDSELNSLNVSRINFSVTEIATFNDCESVLTGFQTVSLNTITLLVTNNSSITQVNNPLTFIDGRDLETDEELRVRHSQSLSQAGAATIGSINTALRQLANVTNVFIRENRTLLTDAFGLPAKSYECIVVNGDPDNIAQEIWDTKPAGIETYGSIATPVTDAYGNPESVNWSRPETYYIWVEVSYSLYDEESFPATGESLIKSAILDYGNSLTLGNDVIPDRFIGGIYRTVDGIDSITVRVGYSTDINDVTPSSGYLTTRIPISDLQYPAFTDAKVEIIPV